jgi:hypothetical protein
VTLEKVVTDCLRQAATIDAEKGKVSGGTENLLTVLMSRMDGPGWHPVFGPEVALWY